MVPLEDQIQSPLVIFGMLLYVPLLLWPVAAIGRADAWRRRWTLVALAVGLGVSAWQFTRTPFWVDPDVTITMDLLGRQNRWDLLWLEHRSISGQGWNALPWYLFNRATGTLLGERVIGFAWHASLILATGAVAPRAGLPIALAMVACTPTAWWLSRNGLGLEILVMQIALLHTWRRGPVVGAGLVLGVLQHTYAAARVTAFYPLIFWRSWRRAALVYALAAVVVLPMWIIAGEVGERAPVRSLQVLTAPEWSKIRRSFVTLFSEDEAVQGAFCYPGMQTLPPVALAAVALGTLRGGAAYTAAGLAGLLPDILGQHGGGRSHRQMMVLLPFAYSAAMAVQNPWLAGGLAAAIAAEGIAHWFEPGLWLRTGGQPFPPQGGLFPCREEPRLTWCDRY